MKVGRIVLSGLLGLGLALLPPGAGAGEGAGAKKWKGVWTDPGDSTLPPDFKVQGEYVSKGGVKLGCQVIALGRGAFQAVVYPGGLPGAGWDGKYKSLLDGRLDGDRATFKPTKGKRKYKAQKPEEFSATAKFPPAGQKDYTATISGERMTLQTEDGKTIALEKTHRKSPTLGLKPPAGAVVLFDGTGTGEWTGGARLDRAKGVLNTDGHDLRTKRKFNNYTVHLEFMEPYRPDARDQGRGNSGFYQVDMYEVQILDSFGLEGHDNECGGIYSLVAPKVNTCLPPLVWQTYDIDFTNAVREGGKKVKNARITAKLNGVVIHDDVEIKGKTGGARGDPEGTPGPLQLQGHGNPLQFRNVWLVERPSAGGKK